MNYTFNGKNIRIPDDTIEKMVNLLDITREEAIQTWLEDEGFLENPEQNALCQKAKESGIALKDMPLEDMDKYWEEAKRKERE